MSNSSVSPNEIHRQQPVRATEIPHLVRIPAAARLIGLPVSLLRKSFISERKRPKNVPPPPPHKRIGRSIYILIDQLPEWVEALTGAGGEFSVGARCKPGRPTVAERIARRRR